MFISKYFTVRNTNGMNNAEKFRYNAKMAVEGLAVNYAGQCVAAAGIGMMEGGAETKNTNAVKAGAVVAGIGGAVMVVGATNTLYHGYKATLNALDYSADKMNQLYASMD